MTLENFIYESVSEILNGKYEEVKESIEKHKEIYHDDTAICFSLLAFGAFISNDNDSFYQFMDDTSFLVDQSDDPITKILHEMILGFVNISEKNTTLYSINYNNSAPILQGLNFIIPQSAKFRRPGHFRAAEAALLQAQSAATMASRTLSWPSHMTSRMLPSSRVSRMAASAMAPWSGR